MYPKALGHSPDEIAKFNDAERTAFARAVLTVLKMLPRVEVNEELAARASGHTTDEMFDYVGLEWVDLLITHGRLSPNGAVLDIGCGAARIALHLIKYLSSDGLYRGFDPDANAIEFCKSLDTQQNFSFEAIDLKHPLYNPNGTVDPRTFEFPYPDGFFNTVFAASVFSHLPTDESAAYLSQVARVLRPRGRAILSYFAITRELEPKTTNQITNVLGHGDSFYSFRFRARGDGFYTHCHADGSPKNHYISNDELGDPVAYHRDKFDDMARRAGLTVIDFLPGSWCRNEYRYGYQDIAVVER